MTPGENFAFVCTFLVELSIVIVRKFIVTGPCIIRKAGVCKRIEPNVVTSGRLTVTTKVNVNTFQLRFG